MTKIYRYMPLTELHNLLNNNQLKFARLSVMDDPNEGLGHVLGFLESFSYSFDIRSQKKIMEYHESIKGRNYITSWTKEPDLMAMWLLYSKNCDSIRVRTTLDKLEDATKIYFNKNYYPKHIDSPEGTLQVDSFPHVQPVKYVSFENLSDKIKEKYQEYIKICTEHALKSSDNFLKELNKLNAKRSIDIFESGYLKDESFSHEKEIRANISLCRRNSVTREYLENSENKDKMDVVMGTATSEYPPSSELPNVIYIPIDENFIESVCFDPRLPSYIRSEQESILRHVCPNLNIEDSKAFGYKPHNHDFFLEKDDY